MHPKHAATLVFLLISTAIFSQKSYLNLNQIKAAQSSIIELAFEAKQINSRHKTYVRSEKCTYEQPFRYERKATAEFPRAQVSYFFCKTDSIVGMIDYYWDMRLARDDSKQEREAKMNAAFDQVVASVSAQIGKPESGQGKQTQRKEEIVVGSPDVLNDRLVVWKLKNAVVRTHLYWSETGHGEGFSTTVNWDN